MTFNATKLNEKRKAPLRMPFFLCYQIMKLESEVHTEADSAGAGQALDTDAEGVADIDVFVGVVDVVVLVVVGADIVVEIDADHVEIEIDADHVVEGIVDTGGDGHAKAEAFGVVVDLGLDGFVSAAKVIFLVTGTGGVASPCQGNASLDKEVHLVNVEQVVTEIGGHVDHVVTTLLVAFVVVPSAGEGSVGAVAGEAQDDAGRHFVVQVVTDLRHDGEIGVAGIGGFKSGGGGTPLGGVGVVAILHGETEVAADDELCVSSESESCEGKG